MSKILKIHGSFVDPTKSEKSLVIFATLIDDDFEEDLTIEIDQNDLFGIYADLYEIRKD